MSDFNFSNSIVILREWVVSPLLKPQSIGQGGRFFFSIWPLPKDETGLGDPARSIKLLPTVTLKVPETHELTDHDKVKTSRVRVRCSFVLERPLVVRWVVGPIPLGRPTELFVVRPVLHDWCKKKCPDSDAYDNVYYFLLTFNFVNKLYFSLHLFTLPWGIP